MATFEKFIRKDSKPTEKVPLISIHPKYIGFNSQFILQSNLQDESRTTIFIDRDNWQLAFKFHSDVADKDSYALAKDGKNARTFQSSALMKEHPWIAAIGRLGQHRARQFQPQWDNLNQLWVITLCPAFESRVSSKSDIPSNARGIYCYKQADEVVYIGRGIIRSRANSPDREDWDFETIEYSLIEDPKQQERWETYWLDRHAEQCGKLPLYNRIGGSREKS